MRCRGSTGGGGGPVDGTGGTPGAEDVVETFECRKSSSVAIDMRGVMSTVLVGLGQDPSFVGGRDVGC